LQLDFSPENLMKILRPLFCAFSAVICISVCFAQTNKTVPRFEKADCAIPIPQGEKPECGFLIVKERRAAKNDKTIRLPIIVLKSENPNPKPDPILRTFGGPGASSMNLVRSRKSSPWLKDRDLIIYEQRGTKYAQPALECPEVNEANINNAKKQLDAKTAKTDEIKAAKICYDRLMAHGIDLSAYNSAESAADIEDLRRVLKLEKINLWGLSYSSRLMLNMMRDFPNGIRSVVLESTLPIEVNYDEVGVDLIIDALNRVFKNCQADAECTKAYPNLEKEFYETVEKFNKEPILANLKDEKTGESVDIKLNGDDFATWIIDYLLSNSPQAIVDTPLVIHLTNQGNYAPFKRYAGDKISPSNYSLGMRYSVWCSEEIPFENRGRITAQSSLYPRLKGYEVMALPDICSVWKVQSAKSVENKLVKSDIPTFVVAAEYDAYTPPDWGKQTAKNLKNSFFMETPWVGHGPSFSTPCLGDLIAEFFNNPKIAPNSSECVEKVRRNFKFTVRKE
jgi:pimeloyl-ACP methyl ester carboxylesterase